MSYVVHEAAPDGKTIIYGVFQSRYAANVYLAKLEKVKPNYTLAVYRLIPEQRIDISGKS